MTQKTQAEADKEFRERYAREAFTRMKKDLTDRIELARRELAKWQRYPEVDGPLVAAPRSKRTTLSGEPSPTSTLIRDYEISINKLIDHIRRMTP